LADHPAVIRLGYKIREIFVCERPLQERQNGIKLAGRNKRFECGPRFVEKRGLTIDDSLALVEPLNLLC